MVMDTQDYRGYPVPQDRGPAEGIPGGSGGGEMEAPVIGIMAGYNEQVKKELDALGSVVVTDPGTAVKGMAAGGSAGTDAIRHIHQYEPMPPAESRIKLERGQKGTYAWEVTVSGSDADAILWKLRDLDSRLRREYGGGE